MGHKSIFYPPVSASVFPFSGSEAVVNLVIDLLHSIAEKYYYTTYCLFCSGLSFTTTLRKARPAHPTRYLRVLRLSAERL